MANPKGKKQKRQAERKRQLRLEAAARHAGISASTTPSSCSNPGKPWPFCMRGALFTTAVSYRPKGQPVHCYQLPFSACGSFHVGWVIRVDLFLWRQHVWRG